MEGFAKLHGGSRWGIGLMLPGILLIYLLEAALNGWWFVLMVRGARKAIAKRSDAAAKKKDS